MKIAAVSILVVCALLTGARIPVFASDVALWRDAVPSDAPRPYVNLSAALLQAGRWAEAEPLVLQAVDKAQRPASAYERAAVLDLVTLQVRYLDTWHHVCSRPAFHSYCS